MSANWKNPFLNKEKLNVQQLDKDFNCSDLEIKLDAELKKHSKNIYAKDMRYIFLNIIKLIIKISQALLNLILFLLLFNLAF